MMPTSLFHRRFHYILSQEDVADPFFFGLRVSYVVPTPLALYCISSGPQA